MQNENDKITRVRAILEKHANMFYGVIEENIINAMLEYAQLIASERCKELEEQIKAKDEEIKHWYNKANLD